jgi:hypothetical protein
MNRDAALDHSYCLRVVEGLENDVEKYILY